MRLVMKCESRGSLPRMNTLYPRKSDDVLLHSTTSRFSKSIFVWIPRLPMIRVTGSHDMLTSLRPRSSPTDISVMFAPSCPLRSTVSLTRRPARVVARGQGGAVVMPLRLLVHRAVRHAAQPP